MRISTCQSPPVGLPRACGVALIEQVIALAIAPNLMAPPLAPRREPYLASRISRETDPRQAHPA